MPKGTWKAPRSNVIDKQDKTSKNKWTAAALTTVDTVDGLVRRRRAGVDDDPKFPGGTTRRTKDKVVKSQDRMPPKEAKKKRKPQGSSKGIGKRRQPKEK